MKNLHELNPQKNFATSKTCMSLIHKTILLPQKLAWA